jgi:hypothetical protein
MKREHCRDCGNPDCPKVDPDPYFRRCPASDRLAPPEPATKKQTTLETVTKEQLQSLRAAQLNKGDEMGVAMIDQAIDGHPLALDLCVWVIQLQERGIIPA